MKDILLVEDNEELAKLIQAFLRREGYSVCHLSDGRDVLEALAKPQEYKLLLLDICLPGMDGFAICRAVRERQSLPILVISARTGREDKLTSYDLGADDYIEKPVDIEILTAKIKALLQRSYGVFQERELLVSGALLLEPHARRAYLDGINIELNGKEYDLLLLFVRHPGKTLHKDYIFNQIWGTDSLSENQTLTVHIKMLRGKIEENPRKPKRIQTVWGVGYRYEEI